MAEGHPLALNEPEPYFYVCDFHENSIEVEFKVWTTKESYWAFVTQFPKAVHRAIKNSGIEQPYQALNIIDRQNPLEER